MTTGREQPNMIMEKVQQSFALSFCTAILHSGDARHEASCTMKLPRCPPQFWGIGSLHNGIKCCRLAISNAKHLSSLLSLTCCPGFRVTARDSPVSDDSSIFMGSPLPTSCRAGTTIASVSFSTMASCHHQLSHAGKPWQCCQLKWKRIAATSLNWPTLQQECTWDLEYASLTCTYCSVTSGTCAPKLATPVP